ncbi:S-adenosyl-L-methionine-dependent methyltransferase [Didymella exigua CBS 183.55]|uniref:S-adenosyl-L-methionine-dependent methyltransferase n=1 Tax=Didymella exigua CBS 183.55 TaxID=1150837 RepID=A0A6A5RMS1_9PLEO|nr:S-adenosyl-L-methionine-dependent methyltransferase [Didymella exigua CBS 183.55]KAF1926817.1 S-adenosyl-L-methionine-dependent methyltransferase [Didymella exigua CBS 183.55]
MAESDAAGTTYEEEHVHEVYEQIASHFSSTRYKPWPIVERFLKEQPGGAIGADVGCGNGKYLAVNKEVFIVGSDRSTNLVTFAKQHKPHDVVVADNLSLPHPPRSFDFAISIAVVHHLSTPARRIEAVACILNLLRPSQQGLSGSGGKALIYVWALEQKSSRRGWDEGGEQDVMVPWVMTAKKEKVPKKKKQQPRGKDEDAAQQSADIEEKTADKTQQQTEVQETKPEDGKVFLRYYHLYRKGELEEDIEKAGGSVVESGYEKDNWWAIASLK